MDQTPPGVLDLIGGWRWFSYVPVEARQWLAAQSTVVRIAKGQVVYVSGMPATAIYGVMTGLFRIYLNSAKGDEITLEEVVRGGWFPHMVPNEKPAYIGNCVCLEDASVALVPMHAVTEFSRRWPDYHRGLYHEFIDRIDVILGRIELLTLHNLDVRLAVYLLRMAHLRGVKGADGSTWVAAHDSQAEIGTRVGGTRQRVNAILKAWSKKRIIECHKDGTRILDLRRLSTEATRSGFELDKYLAGWHGGWQGHK
ncbi:MAG TPA: Crp/Fnr family transcriptional regulator [Verrucomicrobiae bacterium]|nr:Crp/Fnr family transcriptional regulator [Verrucomicrobiae bacterium]